MTARHTLTAMLAVATLACAALAFLNRDLPDAFGAAIFGVLLIAHLYGWRWSAQVTTIITVLFFLSLDPTGPTSQASYALSTLAVAVFAAIVLPWYWSAGAFAICMIGAAVASRGNTLLFQVDVFVTTLVLAAGIVLISVVTRQAQRTAEINAKHIEAALLRTEQQAKDVARQAEELRVQNEEQRRLLDLVSTLETPTVTLAPGALFAPIVGHIDTRRAEALTARLLQDASAQRARLVILDIAGVSVIDTAVAQALMHATQALRLLGCDVAVSGIRSSVAITLTNLGLSLQGVTTVRSPQEALAQYMHNTPPTRNNSSASIS